MQLDPDNVIGRHFTDMRKRNFMLLAERATTPACGFTTNPSPPR